MWDPGIHSLYWPWNGIGLAGSPRPGGLGSGIPLGRDAVIYVIDNNNL